MAGARKLQAEVERTLKRIDEGIVEFDAILERVHTAETQLLKEKFEADLKKEIKKLQKYRDMIKGWVASAEIKNKQPLLDARSRIERKMETFKVVERETKTKAYSKEGLMRDTPLSAEERKRLKTRDWLTDTMHKLYDEMDVIEAEMEALEASSKKKDKETLEQLESIVKHHQWHVDRLEALTRMLDNEQVDPDDVEGIKEDLEYYMEQAREPDYSPDMEVYEQFGIKIADEDEEDDTTAGGGSDDEAPAAAKAAKAAPAPAPAPAPAAAAAAAAPAKPTTAAAPNKDARSGSVGEAAAPPAAPAVSAPTAAVSKPSISDVKTAKTTMAPPAAAAPAPAPAKITPVAAPPITKAPTAAAAVTSTPATATAAPPAGRGKSTGALAPPPGITAASTAATTSTSASGRATTVVTAAPAPAPAKPMAGESLASIVRGKSATPAPAPAPAAAPQVTGPSAERAPQPVGGIAAALSSMTDFAHAARGSSVPPSGTASGPAISVSPFVAPVPGTTPPLTAMPGHADAISGFAAGASLSATASSAAAPATASAGPISPPGGATSREPGMLAALQAASQPAPQPAIMDNPLVPLPVAFQRFNVNALAQSVSHLPEPIDSERPKAYVPRNPAATHASFPSQPPPVLETPALFEKLSLDTLFFIFYYQQGTYQQYLAARELKRQNWRYHARYMTWFQRAEEPKIVTETYEQGNYNYFDFDTGWMMRQKKDFKFEYAGLENELQ